jgi:hypothetical protein
MEFLTGTHATGDKETAFIYQQPHKWMLFRLCRGATWKLCRHMLKFYLEPSATEKGDRIYYSLLCIIAG